MHVRVTAITSLLWVAACGLPEVDNQTPLTVGYTPSQTFTATLTESGNTITTFDLIMEFGVHAMSPVPASEQYTVTPALPVCSLNVQYWYSVQYDSSLPTEPSGALFVREPSAGSYILRRGTPGPGTCRNFEGLNMAVTTSDDLVDSAPGDGVCATSQQSCSLRAAIMEANARPGHDRIQLPPGTYVLRLDGDEALDAPNDAIGDLDVLDGLSITGSGVEPSIVDADRIARVFQIEAGSFETVNLTLLTLTNGSEIDEPGGAIYNASSTKLDQLTLIDNSVNADSESTSCAASVDDAVCNRGGAIFNESHLLVRRSTVRNNRTCGPGGTICDSGHAGGIANFGTGARLYLEDSTIAENSARFVGGVQNIRGRVDALNTTFYNNAPLHWVSSIYSADGSVTLQHVTFSEHTDLPAVVSSNVLGEYADVRMESSIVHLSGANGTLCQGPLQTIRNNFVGGSDADADYIGNCDVSGQPPQRGRISMGGLFDHGGPTETIEIIDLDGNLEIIDHGSLVCPNADQRGVSRSSAADGLAKLGCDPGALEH